MNKDNVHRKRECISIHNFSTKCFNSKKAEKIPIFQFNAIIIITLF